MRKNYIAIALATLISLTLCGPIRVNAEVLRVAIIEQNGRTYVPIKAMTTKMGGTVERKDADKAYFFSLNGKTVRLDDNIPFGSVDGEFAPFETRDVRGFKVPVFNKAIYKDDDIYVPINFLTDSVGLKLEAKDGQVAFETVGGSDTVATTTTPSSNSGTGSNSPVVESNRPATTKPTTPTNNGGNSGGSTTTPTQPTNPSGGNTGGTTPTTPTQPEQPKPEQPKPQPTKTYTGSQVKQKLYGLDFFDYGGGVAYNIYGKDGLSEYTFLGYKVMSGDTDMAFTIYNSNPEVDQKIRTVLGYILPSEGGRLYSILDNPQLKPQTLTMEGRTVQIRIENFGIIITFGPIVK